MGERYLKYEDAQTASHRRCEQRRLCPRRPLRRITKAERSVTPAARVPINATHAATTRAKVRSAEPAALRRSSSRIPDKTSVPGSATKDRAGCAFDKSAFLSRLPRRRYRWVLPVLSSVVATILR